MAFTPRPATAATAAVREARDFLMAHGTDYEGAVAGFRWPELEEFNFATEWFDVVAGEHPDRNAVTIVSPDLVASSWTYAQLSERSDQVARWLRSLGLGAGDRIIVMLNNTIELWELLLALLKIRAVAIPTSTLLSAADLAFRVERGHAKAVVAPSALRSRVDELPKSILRIGVGEQVPGWVSFAESENAPTAYSPSEPTLASDLSLLYFTSGTTSRPKLVRHTQVSYPVGHLSTMWWLGVRPGDVHLNISSPGWGKHAWSNFFSPFLAQATVFVFNYERFDASALMKVMDTHDVTSFCAPPTVWRMLIQADLSQLKKPPRELAGPDELTGRLLQLGEVGLDEHPPDSGRRTEAGDVVGVHDLHQRGGIEALVVEDEDRRLREERGEEVAPRMLAPTGRGDVEMHVPGSYAQPPHRREVAHRVRDLGVPDELRPGRGSGREVQQAEVGGLSRLARRVRGGRILGLAERDPSRHLLPHADPKDRLRQLVDPGSERRRRHDGLGVTAVDAEGEVGGAEQRRGGDRHSADLEQGEEELPQLDGVVEHDDDAVTGTEAEAAQPACDLVRPLGAVSYTH